MGVRSYPHWPQTSGRTWSSSFASQIVSTYKCVPPCQAQSFSYEFSSTVGGVYICMHMQVHLCMPVRARGWYRVPSQSLSTFLFEIGFVRLPCTGITDTLYLLFLASHVGTRVLMTKTHTLLVCFWHRISCSQAWPQIYYAAQDGFEPWSCPWGLRPQACATRLGLRVLFVNGTLYLMLLWPVSAPSLYSSLLTQPASDAELSLPFLCSCGFSLLTW